MHHQTRRASVHRRAIVEAVLDYWDEHGYGPTYPELAEATGLNEHTVKRHVAALLEDGTLTRTKNRHGSLRVY